MDQARIYEAINLLREIDVVANKTAQSAAEHESLSLVLTTAAAELSQIAHYCAQGRPFEEAVHTVALNRVGGSRATDK